MISPYVDMTLSARSITTLKKRDPMLTKYALQRGSDGYRDSIATCDPRISPLFADLYGLPPLLIQAGSEEILLDDALRLAEYAEISGVYVDCQVLMACGITFRCLMQFCLWRIVQWIRSQCLLSNI